MRTEPWFHLFSGPLDAAWNMAWDEALLNHVAQLGVPVLRTYGWTSPAATFGYFQKLQEIESWTPLRPLIRRPTGGGLVPHDADWTYSVIIPPQHPGSQVKAETSYESQHLWLKRAFDACDVHTELAPCCDATGPGQCFVGAEKHDLLFRGRKIAGAAQRRNRLGLLIQGSVHPPVSTLNRGAWEGALLASRPEAHWSPLVPSSELRAQVEYLAQSKYLRPEYNGKR